MCLFVRWNQTMCAEFNVEQDITEMENIAMNVGHLIETAQNVITKHTAVDALLDMD